MHQAMSCAVFGWFPPLGGNQWVSPFEGSPLPLSLEGVGGNGHVSHPPLAHRRWSCAFQADFLMKQGERASCLRHVAGPGTPRACASPPHTIMCQAMR